MNERPTRLVAHTPIERSDVWHDLDQHLLTVARMAAEFAAPFDGQDFAWWLGMYHDLGKAHPDFQEYLWQSYIHRPEKQKSVDHKTAGTVRIREIGGEPLAQVVHGHHGGLDDADVVNGKVRAYLERDAERLQRSIERFDQLGLISSDALHQHPPQPPIWFGNEDREMDVLLRMLFSCLVDADGLDTEAHMNPEKSEVRRQRSFPPIVELWDRFQADQVSFDARIRGSAVADSLVNQVRRDVYDACLGRATRPPGFFRLTVPTGGGKTRSGLAFALKHAVEHGLRRVIVAVPFITITEQTADVYTRALGTDALIEHHSGLEPTEFNRDRDDSGSEDLDRMRQQLAMQTWDAPLIVTTTVQLFESLFTNRISRARKLHNIAGSVIILDEIQTLPPDLREPILDMLHELVAHYRVSVVLSTATQPVLDTIARTLETGGRPIVELAPDPPQLFSVLKRVDYELPCLEESWDWVRIADEMRTADQVLAIVNTIANAGELHATLDDAEALHLSTRMCGAHRRDVLAEIRRRLRDGEPCRVVSTQLVEAGVDLDFPLVLRAIGPLDRIVQAAGRCNREGKLDGFGRVVVFDPIDGGMPPGIYRQGADEARIMLQEPDRDLHRPDTFLDYFTRLYGLTDADRRNIQTRRRDLQFAAVADEFHIIDDDTFPVLVKYRAKDCDGDQGSQWKANRAALLEFERFKRGSLRLLMRQAQPYLVACRFREKDRLLESGLIAPLITDVVWEWLGGYDQHRGITETRTEPGGLHV